MGLTSLVWVAFLEFADDCYHAPNEQRKQQEGAEHEQHAGKDVSKLHPDALSLKDEPEDAETLVTNFLSKAEEHAW